MIRFARKTHGNGWEDRQAKAEEEIMDFFSQENLFLLNCISEDSDTHTCTLFFSRMGGGGVKKEKK